MYSRVWVSAGNMFAGARMTLTQSPLATALNKVGWNHKFAEWHRPPSDAEEGRVQRAARMIHEVVRSDPNIGKHNVEVIPQGSYHNNTNVRLNSDMDLCVRFGHQFVWKIPPDLDVTAADLGINVLPSGTVGATARWLKNTLYEGLRLKFGGPNVEYGNKALKVRGVDGSRVNADVVPAIGYWLARPGFLGAPYIVKGTAIYTDEGLWIYNFPEEHHEFGKLKNERTGRRYKRTVRILKRLSGELGLPNPPPSFLVESLTYNCPDALFSGDDDWYETISLVLTWIYKATEDPISAASLVEANGIKPLFAPEQPWTVQQANAFAGAAFLKIIA